MLLVSCYLLTGSHKFQLFEDPKDQEGGAGANTTYTDLWFESVSGHFSHTWSLYWVDLKKSLCPL